MEEKYYQELTSFQKTVVDALKELGYKWQFSSRYCKNYKHTIDVSHFTKWSDVLAEFFKAGEHEKQAEIKNVLGVIDPRI